MAYGIEKEKAVVMRKRGNGIGTIARNLHLPKSTVANWCRSVPITKAQLDTLRQKSRNAGAASLRLAVQQKRNDTSLKIKALVSTGKREVGVLSRRDRFLVGLALYWGEGYKNSSGEFGFTNSDPAMIRFYMRWLKEILGVNRNRLILRISLNKSHAHRIEAVMRYWKGVTGVPYIQFTKTSLIQSISKKKYLNEKRYFGTLRIKVRNGIDMRRQVLGSIEKLKEY